MIKIVQKEDEVLRKISKDIDIKRESNFYSEIIKTLKEYDERYELDYIIIASPAFWKEYLMKELKDSDLNKL